MVDGTIANTNMELMEQQSFVLKDLIQQQEETAESTGRFQNVVSQVGTDIRGGVNKKIEGIKGDIKGTLKNVPDTIAASMDPFTGTLLKGVTSTIKKAPTAASYAKGLFSKDDDKKKKSKTGKNKDTANKKNENLEKATSEQNKTLSEISTNTLNTQKLIENLVTIMQGSRLDELEARREKSRAAAAGLGVGATGAGAADVADDETNADETLGIFDKLKEKFLEITGAGAILGAAFKKVRTGISSVGKSIATAGRIVATSAATAAKAAGRGAASVARALGGGRGRAAAAGATAAGSAVKNLLGGGSSPKPSGAPPRPGGPGGGTKVRVPKAPASTGGGGGMAKAAARYPKLLKFAKFIRGVPGLNVLAAGVEGIMLASDDEMPPEQKKEELARILGGALGGAGGAKLGAILGTLAFPGLGTIAGTLAGGVGGYFLGGYAAKKIAGTLLEKPEGGGPPMPNGGATSSGNTRRSQRGGQQPSVGGTRQNTQDVGLERAQADRQAASTPGNASQSSQSSVNVANNVTNNSNTTVQNRPSASSTPDNMSDTMMAAGFAP